MSKFPNAIPIPDQVLKARAEREKKIITSARIGMAFRTVIVLLELAGSWFTQSSSLFTDAISNLADVASTIFLVICIKLAKRPPDWDHPFGHGRYEPFGGFLLGALMISVGGVLLIQQVFGAVREEMGYKIPNFAWIIPLAAVILLEFCYWLNMRTARKEKSSALVAEALHYRVDSLTSLLAMIALLFAAYLPDWGIIFDRIGAVAIALFMVGVGFYSSRANFHQLMDKVPEVSFFDKVRKSAKRVVGVLETEKIRIQSYGPDAHVDIDIEVAPQMSVEEAHQISQQVRNEIQKDWPAVRDVIVHVEPYYANDH